MPRIERVQSTVVCQSLTSLCQSIETSGVIGPKSKMKLGSRMLRHTGDEHAITYLLQRLSIEIQRGNSASIMGSI